MAFDTCGVACFIIPLFWILNKLAAYSHPDLDFNMVCKKKKFLAITKVRPNLTSSSAEKYKGFSKFIKGKKFRRVFKFLNFLTIV